MTTTIREMTIDDIPVVVTLETEVYDEPWSERVFMDELSTENREYVVITNGDASIVGYGGLLVVDEDAHITTLAVAPEAQGRRLGKRLLLALVMLALGVGAKHLTLEVRLSNSSAQGLYELFGFTPVGRRKGYYKDEDALVMWATDIDSQEYADRIATIRDAVEADET